MAEDAQDADPTADQPPAAARTAATTPAAGPPTTDPPPPDNSPADVAATDPRWAASPTKIAAGVVLLIGIVVPLLVGSYASVEPRIFGFPFFYAYQLIWVFLAAGCCGIAYLLLRSERRRYEAGRAARSTTPAGSGR